MRLFALSMALIAVSVVFTILTPDVGAGDSRSTTGVVPDVLFGLTLLCFPIVVPATTPTRSSRTRPISGTAAPSSS